MRRMMRRLGAFVVGIGVVAGQALVEAAAGHADSRVRTTAQKSAQKKKGKARKAPAKPSTPAEEPKPDALAASSDGALKFSRDIAPILVANCGGCHNARRLQGKLDLSSFQAIMTGTPDEKVIVPGKPEESHLVLRIKGEEQPRMPRGANRTLSEEAIARIERWVKEGALLDAGIEPRAALETYAATPEDLRKAELARMTSADRDKKVEEVGLERLKKISTRQTPEVTPSAHFLMFGNVPKARVGGTLRAAESAYGQLRPIVGDNALNLGEKISIYVFIDRANFVEFARVVENREIDADVVSTVNFGIAEPYIAVLDPQGGGDEAPAAGAAAPRRSPRGKGRGGSGDGEERTLGGLVAEQLGIGAVSRAAKAPRWLALGLGAQLAARVDPRSSQVVRLRNLAAELAQLGWNAKASDALGNNGSTEELQAVGFVVVESLGRSARQAYPAFVRGMFAGQEKLDDVIGTTLGINRDAFLQATSTYAASFGGR